MVSLETSARLCPELVFLLTTKMLNIEKKSNKQKVTFLKFGRYLLGGIGQYLEILLVVLNRKVLLSSSR